MVSDVKFPLQASHSQLNYFMRPDNVIHETAICSAEWENTQSDCTICYTKICYASFNTDLEVQGRQIICWLASERGINYLSLWTRNTKWKGIAQSVQWPSTGLVGRAIGLPLLAQSAHLVKTGAVAYSVSHAVSSWTVTGAWNSSFASI